jgi:hypothetical protein
VANYLHRGDERAGLRVGATAGLLAAVPLAAVTAFVAVGLTVLPEGVAAFVAGTTLFSLLVGVGYFVGLGALGGYLVVALRDGRDAATAAH